MLQSLFEPRSWQNMEEAKRLGLCKHIGVSNYPLAFMKASSDALMYSLCSSIGPLRLRFTCPSYLRRPF